MEAPARDAPARAVLARTIVVAAATVALVSALWGLKVELPRLHEDRTYWSAVPPESRDDMVTELYGYGDARAWHALHRTLQAGERYAVVAEGIQQYDIRNYAAYSLLPAILVRDPADADIVIYHGVRGPPGCIRVGPGVCFMRRAP